MNQTVVCRCPKCKGGNLRISEIFTVADITFISGGVIQGTTSGEYPQATGAVYIRCEECDHNWRSRRSIAPAPSYPLRCCINPEAFAYPCGSVCCWMASSMAFKVRWAASW